MKDIFLSMTVPTRIFALYLAILLIYALVSAQLKESSVIVQALIITFLPRIFAHYYKIKIPFFIECGVALIVLGTLILGEFDDFYELLWWWDIALHTISGFLMAVGAGIVVGHIYVNEKVQDPKMTQLVVALAILASVGLSGAWEVYEFLADTFLGTAMQPSGDDTMQDLIVGMVGACLAAPFIKRYSISS